MKFENKTSLAVSLNDLFFKQQWEVEYGKDFKLSVVLLPLNDWKVSVRWLRGKHPYRGFCSPKEKLILIALNPKNKYPLTAEVAVGTQQVNANLYKYVFQTITFNNPSELARFIFLHELSHLIDYLRGLSLQMKQTKANRFALENLKGDKP